MAALAELCDHQPVELVRIAGGMRIVTGEEMVKICQNRDKSYTGKFFLAVKSTKIVCNPGCSSKVPLEKNMVFYNTLEEALADGYRPCKVCMKELRGN